MSRRAVNRPCFCVLLGVSLLAPLPSAGADMTPAEAFSQGRDFGAAQAGAIGGQVTTGTAQTQLPEYHNSAPAEALFQGGNGALFVPGQGRKDFCAAPGGALPDREKYDCDAVNLMSDVNNARAALQINRQTDPLLNNPNRTAVKANPELFVGASPAQTGNTCVERQVTDPGQTRIEICNQAYGIESLTCQKILTVAVTVDNTCTPGLWFADNYTGAPWADWWAGDGWTAQPLCEFRADNLQLWRYGSLVNLGRNCAATSGLHQTYLDMGAVDSLPVLADSGLFPNFHRFDNNCGGPIYAFYRRNGCTPSGQTQNCSATWVFSRTANPFTYSYAACRPGTLPGDQITTSVTSCDPFDPSLCSTTSIPLNAAQCYTGPSACGSGFLQPPCVAPATFACHPAAGCGGYSPDAAPRTVTGWSIADPSATQAVTVGYLRPGQTFTTADTWDNQCAAYEARQ